MKILCLIKILSFVNNLVFISNSNEKKSISFMSTFSEKEAQKQHYEEILLLSKRLIAKV